MDSCYVSYEVHIGVLISVLVDLIGCVEKMEAIIFKCYF